MAVLLSWNEMCFHDTHYDMQCTTPTRRGAGYCLSTGSRASATNLPCSGYRHHWDEDTVEIESQSRRSLPLRSTACTPTNVNAEFPTQPPPEPKRRNKVDLVSFPTFRRIRRLLTPSGDRPLLTQKAVWIAPAQCVEVEYPIIPQLRCKC
ncbi:hypothetical protein EDD16DRAFT_265961 [Pisolithus croceorrhizus]|nr:hypothetical protein EDD16DRAFT_265961 [Pisolithus croceorrhizus]